MVVPPQLSSSTDPHTAQSANYSKTCLKRNAIVPAFFSVFTGFRFTKGCVFPFYKGLCFSVLQRVVFSVLQRVVFSVLQRVVFSVLQRVVFFRFTKGCVLIKQSTKNMIA